MTDKKHYTLHEKIFGAICGLIPDSKEVDVFKIVDAAAKAAVSHYNPAPENPASDFPSDIIIATHARIESMKVFVTDQKMSEDLPITAHVDHHSLNDTIKKFMGSFVEVENVEVFKEKLSQTHTVDLAENGKLLNLLGSVMEKSDGVYPSPAGMGYKIENGKAIVSFEPERKPSESQNTLFTEAIRLYNLKEYSQDGRNLVMDKFTIARKNL